mmetsp:Transcript_9182/g.29788  ORF Transcript_9182/g.29788 Transcript_9182/m.29788 type:complete len:274 (-) Transcript_9182:1007-1828(-)
MYDPRGPMGASEKRPGFLSTAALNAGCHSPQAASGDRAWAWANFNVFAASRASSSRRFASMSSSSARRSTSTVRPLSSSNLALAADSSSSFSFSCASAAATSFARAVISSSLSSSSSSRDSPFDSSRFWSLALFFSFSARTLSRSFLTRAVSFSSSATVRFFSVASRFRALLCFTSALTFIVVSCVDAEQADISLRYRVIASSRPRIRDLSFFWSFFFRFLFRAAGFSTTFASCSPRGSTPASSSSRRSSSSSGSSSSPPSAYFESKSALASS